MSSQSRRNASNSFNAPSNISSMIVFPTLFTTFFTQTAAQLKLNFLVFNIAGYTQLTDLEIIEWNHGTIRHILTLPQGNFSTSVTLSDWAGVTQTYGRVFGGAPGPDIQFDTSGSFVLPQNDPNRSSDPDRYIAFRYTYKGHRYVSAIPNISRTYNTFGFPFYAYADVNPTVSAIQLTVDGVTTQAIEDIYLVVDSGADTLLVPQSQSDSDKKQFSKLYPMIRIAGLGASDPIRTNRAAYVMEPHAGGDFGYPPEGGLQINFADSSGGSGFNLRWGATINIDQFMTFGSITGFRLYHNGTVQANTDNTLIASNNPNVALPGGGWFSYNIGAWDGPQFLWDGTIPGPVGMTVQGSAIDFSVDPLNVRNKVLNVNAEFFGVDNRNGQTFRVGFFDPFGGVNLQIRGQTRIIP